MQTIQQLWNEVVKEMELDGEQNNLRDMKRAFYAGAVAVIAEMADPGVGTDRTILMVDEWMGEIRQFGRDVDAGIA